MGIESVGSVEDIRCSLRFINPKTDKKRNKEIEALYKSIQAIQDRKNHKTVEKMLNTKIKQLRKLILPK